MPAPSLIVQRTIPIRHAVDIFVAGGGPAGIAAAVAAARQGRRVFLAEGQCCFGGMGTSGGLPMFCGLTDAMNFLAGGVGREVYERLWRAGGMANGTPRDLSRQSVFFKGEVLKRVYDQMMLDAGIEFSLMTNVIDVETDGERITAAICAGKSGLFAVTAELFLDCTGDADLCARAGAPFEKGDAEGHLQAGTLCSVWANIDWEAANAAGHGCWQQEAQLPRAFADHLFSVEDPHLPGMIPVAPHVGYGNIGHAFGVDGTDERSLTSALIQARQSLLEYERFYKEYLTGYQQMELVGTASVLGIRESRRIVGDYVLNREDFLRRAVFEDEIGRFAYGVDLHAATPSQKDHDDFLRDFSNLRLAPGESYGIPYRILLPRGLQNLLTAGRCVSTDRAMQASLRVMPGCFITGQAAGVAAALAVEQHTDTRHISLPELQARLLHMGAFLPSAAADHCCAFAAE
jgi:hypothetical protein